MANALKTLFTDIATAIRETLVDVESMKPSSFPDRIREVAQSGGSSDLVKYVTFMSWDGATELFKMPVLSGDDCKDPVTRGDIDTPTKESTNTDNFGYSGWSLTSGGSVSSSALKNVTEDRVVYASFTSSVRYYTVNFYDETDLLKTVQVTYGADASELHKPTKDGFRFSGWIPDVSNVTGDITTYAQWVESLLLENASWDKIAEASENGTASQLWSVGDKKSVTMSDGTTINVVIAGFNHDDLADGSGKAGITFLYDTLYGTTPMFNNSSYRYDNWGYSTPLIHGVLETQRTTSLPSELSKHIKPVLKKYYDRETDDAGGEPILTRSGYLWIPSTVEIGMKVTQSNIHYGEGETYPFFTPNKEVWDDLSELLRYDSNGTAQNWWVRTKTNSTKTWECVTKLGKYSYIDQYTSGYILAGFCI